VENAAVFDILGMPKLYGSIFIYQVWARDKLHPNLLRSYGWHFTL
jgi:hypothetical protein